MLLAASLSSKYRAGRIDPEQSFLIVPRCPLLFLLLSLRSRSPSFAVFCRFDPCVVVFHIVSCCRFNFDFFRLEELVDLVFPLSSRSSYGSVESVFCAEFRVPFSSFYDASFFW